MLHLLHCKKNIITFQLHRNDHSHKLTRRLAFTMRSIASRHAAPRSGEKLHAKNDDTMTSSNRPTRSYKKQKGGPLRQLNLLRIKWNLLRTKQKLIMIIAVTCFHIFFVYNLQVSFMIPSTSTSRIRQHPRILCLHTIENKRYQIHKHVPLDKYPHRKVEDEWAYNADIDHGYEEFEEGDCKAMHQWQIESYPSCNLIHETDMLSYTYITSGGYRDVWYTHDNDGSRFVVKSLVWDGKTASRMLYFQQKRIIESHTYLVSI